MNAPGQSSHAVLRPEEAAGVLTVDLGALAANWRAMKARAGAARCSAVVKADAYGIGLERASAALAGAGCDVFFVALIDEARRLRATLPTATIYVLNGLARDTAAEFRKHRLEPVLGSWPEIDEWDAFAAASGESVATPSCSARRRRRSMRVRLTTSWRSSALSFTASDASSGPSPRAGRTTAGPAPARGERRAPSAG